MHSPPEPLGTALLSSSKTTIRGFHATPDVRHRRHCFWHSSSCLSWIVGRLCTAMANRHPGKQRLWSFILTLRSKTLAEVHLIPSAAHGSNRRFHPKPAITEAVLWGYISQIAGALKAIDSNNLAARCLDVSKIILTDKNGNRLSA